MQRKYRRFGNHSIMVVDRKQAVADLAAALCGAQGDTASVGLEERLRAVLAEGERMPDVRLLLELLGRLVKQAGADLDGADKDRWLADMSFLNLRHDTAKARADLYGAAVRVRKNLVECYGAEVCRRVFGFSERTPRGAENLADEVRTLVSRLRNLEIVLPEPRLATAGDAREQWIGDLLPGLEKLERLLGEKRLRAYRAGDEVLACRKTLESCDAAYLEAARTAEALFVLAGCRELARRLRPSQRRLRRRRAAAAARKALAIVARVQAVMASSFQWLRGWLTRAPSSGTSETPDLRKLPVFPPARGGKTAPKA
jgi:hypothetical protein